MTEENKTNKGMNSWLRRQAGLEEPKQTSDQGDNKEINEAIRSGDDLSMNDAIRKLAGKRTKIGKGEQPKRKIVANVGSGTRGSQGVPNVGVADSMAVSDLLRFWLWHKTVTRKRG